MKVFKHLFLFLILPVLFGTHACADEKIKIGVILPLTGDMAAVGTACRDAVQLALKDSTDSNKREYEILFEDDRLTPNEVAKAAQKLISYEKVSAIISTWSYGGQIVSPLAQKAGIPHIGVAWDYMIAEGDYNFLHLTPPSEFMKRFLDAFQKLGVKRVALLGIEESGSVFALDEFERLAPDYGVQVIFRDAVLWDLNDFSSLVAKLVQKKPDYLLFNLGGEMLISRLLHSLQTLQVSFPYTAITAFDVLEDTSRIEGLWYVSDSYLPQDFATRFQSQYGHKLRYGVGNFYEAMRLIIQSFENSKSGSPEEVKDQLLAVKNTPSIFGATTVTPKGIFTYPAKYMRIWKGARVQITLEDVEK